MGNYIVLPLIVVFLRMTYGLLREKESKIKEDLKIMGMSDSSFYLSWIIHYEIIYLIISLFASAFLKISMDLNVFFFINLIDLIWSYITLPLALLLEFDCLKFFHSNLFCKCKSGKYYRLRFFLTYVYSIVFNNIIWCTKIKYNNCFPFNTYWILFCTWYNA